MSLPAVSCPCCNVQLPLEAWISNAATREAFLALAQLHPSMRLPMTCLRYIGLFAPVKHAMRWERIADLMGEVKTLISQGTVDWKHQVLPAPLEYWLAGMEQVLAKPDLKRPLVNHNYLKAVVAGLGDQAATSEEKRRLTQGRGETPIGAPVAPTAGASETGSPRPKHNPQAAAEAMAQAKSILKGPK